MNAYYDLLTDTIVIDGMVFDAASFRKMAKLVSGQTITLTRKVDKTCIRIVEKV